MICYDMLDWGNIHKIVMIIFKYHNGSPMDGRWGTQFPVANGKPFGGSGIYIYIYLYNIHIHTNLMNNLLIDHHTDPIQSH